MSRLKAEYQKLKNQYLYCLQVNDTLFIFNKKKVEMVQTLVENGFDPDPIKAWEASQKMDDKETANNLDADSEETIMANYHYLLAMPNSMSLEEKEELLSKRQKTLEKINDLKVLNPAEMWLKDLEELERQPDKTETGNFIIDHGEYQPSPFAERVAFIEDDDHSAKDIEKESSPVHMKNSVNKY